MTTSERGFTLIEVMVALVVVAIALPALVITLYSQVDGTGYLRDKSMAHWVATNKLVETRLQVTSTGLMFKGERSGMMELAGREWFWQLSSTETPQVADFYRLEISVHTEDPEEADEILMPIYSVVGFIAADAAEEL